MRIAINGCGIAGPTLAWWLRHHGFEPVIFERAPQLRTGGYAVDFWGTGYRIAETMGIMPGVKEDGYVFQRLKSVSASGRTMASLRASAIVEAAGGDYITIPRSDLSRRIFEACAGIEAHFGCSIDALEDTGDGVAVALSDGRTESFDLVIGADGLHSNVRSLVFGPQAQFERRIGLHVAAFMLKGYRPRDELTYVQFAQPGLQIGRLALRDDMTMFLFVFADRLLDSEPFDEAGQKAALRHVFGGVGWEADAILARLDEVADVYFDRVSQIEMPRWSRGRVGLVGDAAACPSLLAGEGTGLGMTEAYFLAGELRRAGGDHVAAFAAFETRLKEYVAGKQAGARRFKGFFAPKSRFGLVLREFAIKLAAIPFLTRPLLGAGLANQIELPDFDASGEPSPRANT
jgi:2-polyprenyl-6-methoxyphenol hydroxylase-like FAD-dependent oxidoreductase